MSETGTLTAVEAMRLALAELDDAIQNKAADVRDLHSEWQAAENELVALEDDYTALEEGLRVMEERSNA